MIVHIFVCLLSIGSSAILSACFCEKQPVKVSIEYIPIPLEKLTNHVAQIWFARNNSYSTNRHDLPYQLALRNPEKLTLVKALSTEEKMAKLFVFALQNNLATTIENLYISGFNVNSVLFSDNRTGLICAAMYNRKAAVEKLLHLNADTEIEDASGNKALTYAAIKGYDDVVDLLCKKGAKVDDAFAYAAAYGQITTVKLLVKNGGLNSDQIEDAYLSAKDKNHTDTAMYLKNLLKERSITGMIKSLYRKH